MSALLPVIAALAAGLGVLGLFGVGWLIHSLRLREQVERRMDLAGTGEEPVERGSRLLAGMAARGEAIDKLFDEHGESEQLFRQAGWRRSQDRVVYYAVQAGLPLAVAIVLLFGAIGGAIGGLQLLIYGFAVVAAALLLPRYMLRYRAARRKLRIRNEVPMFIHLLALLFDAGLSLRQALVSMVREGGEVLPELGREIRSVLRQLEAGGDPAIALHEMGRGMDVAELSSVLGVLRQIDRYGGELRAPLMDVLEVVEERRRLALREKVNGLSGKMTVVMVLFFFPALLVFVAGPAFLSVMRALGGGP